MPYRVSPAVESETEASCPPDTPDHVLISDFGAAGNAHMVRHPAWLEQAKSLVQRFTEQVKHCRYHFDEPIGPSVAAGFFIACEQQQACEVACDMVRHDGSLRAILTGGKPVPLVYGADSGLHTAIGFAAGLKKACPEANIQISPLGRPDKDAPVIQAAEESGMAVFCDSIICSGRTCVEFLRALHKVERSLKIYVYSNGAKGEEGSEDIEGLNRIKHYLPHQTDELVFRVSAIGFDPFDRGDAIAYIDDPHTRALQPMLLKRPIVDWDNNKSAPRKG